MQQTSLTPFQQFHKRSHKWGRLSIALVIGLTLALPLYLSFGLGYHPGASVIANGFLAYAAVIFVVWFVEPISYYPILGVSGTYLGFLNGNIGNMCLPAASMALNVAEEQPGTERGEIIATLAIAASAIVNTLILLLVVLGGSYFISILPADILATFAFVLPAIFGAVVAQLSLEKPLWGAISMGIALLVHFGGAPRPLHAFICIFGTVLVVLLLQWFKHHNMERSEA